MLTHDALPCYRPMSSAVGTGGMLRRPLQTWRLREGRSKRCSRRATARMRTCRRALRQQPADVLLRCSAERRAMRRGCNLLNCIDL